MTSIVFHDAFLHHDTGRHPENADRLRRIREYLHSSEVGEKWPEIAPREATFEDLVAVHSDRYLEALDELARRGGGQIDPDTVYSAGTPLASRLAAGALLVGADRLMRGEDQRVFALVRPPGHHATPGCGMGFCIYNNVALAARYLQRRHGVERVAIFDFDVHHGNGTQDAFYDDPTVLFVSLHRSPFYPGTGAATERGAGDGEGTTINVPLPGGTDPARYLDCVRQVCSDHLQPFAPEVLIFSAGFDAYVHDPIGGLGLEVDHYHEITRTVVEAVEASTQGRILSSLEGGYDLGALGPLVARHLEALAPDA